MSTLIQPNPDKLPGWWVPKLHEGTAPATADHKEIRKWCEQYCTAPFYTYPSWTLKLGAQFEDEEDAASFSTWANLRWG